MSEEKILEKVIAVFATMADTDEEITADSELMEDLNISSMDILMLMTSLEEEFKISIPEKEIRKMVTVGDVVEVVSARIG